MGNRKILTIVDQRNVAIAISTKFLATDFDIAEGNIIRMNPIILDAGTIEYTLDGTLYNELNQSIQQVAKGSYMWRFMCSAGDKFNVRIKEGTATTIQFFKVELWLEI